MMRVLTALVIVALGLAGWLWLPGQLNDHNSAINHLAWDFGLIKYDDCWTKEWQKLADSHSLPPSTWGASKPPEPAWRIRAQADFDRAHEDGGRCDPYS